MKTQLSNQYCGSHNQIRYKSRPDAAVQSQPQRSKVQDWTVRMGDEQPPDMDAQPQRSEQQEQETNHKLRLRSYHYLDVLAAYSRGRRTARLAVPEDFRSWLKLHLEAVGEKI